MNAGKVGRPFRYPDSMVEWGMRLKVAMKATFRFVCGHMRRILKAEGVRCISYTQFHERMLRMTGRKMDDGPVTDARVLASCACKVGAKDKKITVAVDSTGLRLSSAGRWMQKRWNTKDSSGWLKLHAAVDVSTNEILAYTLTTEECGDGAYLVPLLDIIDGHGHSVEKVLADGAYDHKSIWTELVTCRGIGYVTNIRHETGKRSNLRFKDCAPRGLMARERELLGERPGRRSTGTG